MRKLSVPAIAIIFLLTACTKIESTDIGNGIVGPLNSVTTFDTTLDVITQNFLEEGIPFIPRVYKADDNVVGTIKTDPLFGTTTASSYFELKPDFFPFYFTGTDKKLDSVVLCLKWTDIFGDSTKAQNWEVREVNQQIRSDSSYNTNIVVSTGNIIATSAISTVGLYDSNGKKPIRIKLSSTFASRLFGYDSVKTSANNAYYIDSIFRIKFAGLAVVPAAGNPGNALISLNLQDTATKLAFYYNTKATDTSSKRDTLISSFRFSTGSATTAISANANSVIRNRTGSTVNNYVNTTKNDEVFIQTSPGTFATIKIPALKSLSNIIIHRAELIAEQDPDNVLYDPIFFAPRYLLLSAYDSLNKYKINVRNDFIYDPNSGPNIATFGGFRFNKNVAPFGSVAAYNFDLTRYVQGIVTRKDSSYTLRLSAPTNDSLFYTSPYPATGAGTTSMLYLSPAVANNTAFGRVRLAGGDKTKPNRMRLRIIYSKI